MPKQMVVLALVTALAGAIALAARAAGGVDLLSGSWKRVNLAGLDVHTHVDVQAEPGGVDARGHFRSTMERPSGTTVFRGA